MEAERPRPGVFMRGDSVGIEQLNIDALKSGRVERYVTRQLPATEQQLTHLKSDHDATRTYTSHSGQVTVKGAHFGLAPRCNLRRHVRKSYRNCQLLEII